MPTISTPNNSGLTWNQVARYYGVSLSQLLRGQSGAVIRQAARNGGNDVIGGGITLRVPDVRDERGQRRPRQNVFRNQNYINRVTGTALQQGAVGGMGGNALQQGVVSGAGGMGGYNAGGTINSTGTSVALPPGSGGGGGASGGGDEGEDEDTGIPGGGGGLDGDGGLSDVEVANASAEILAAFPWLEQLGLGGLVSGLIIEGYETPYILAQIRASSQYQAMFPNITRGDGTMRMSEGAYMTQMDLYRGVVQQYGLSYDNAALSNFLANDIDANELNQRLRTWDSIQRGSADLRAAFYVYAGISFSDDELYRFAVDENYQGQVINEYQSRAQDLDYQTFLTRAAEIATRTHDVGFDTQTNVALLDQLLHGGDPTNGRYLSLSELLNAYDAAMIASAATSVGLALPDLSRIEEFRMVGISHAQARQGYGQFARDQNFLDAVVQRARGTGFGQAEFEEASFLSDPDQQRNLARGMAQEEARARDGGGFTFGQQSGRLTQEGLSAFRS